MVKKFLIFFFSIFLVIFSIIIAIKMSKEVYTINDLLKNPDQVSFLRDKIKNKVNFKDEFIDIEIKNVLALRKNVKIYQWIETKKVMKKTGAYVYLYNKDWSDKFIDSNKFHDKTKNNYKKNALVYKSEIMFSENIITKKDGYELDSIYFEDKIKLQKLEFKNMDVVFRGAPMKKSYNIKYEEQETYKDLDSYIAAKEKKIAEKDVDKFKIIDKTILFNGNDYKNPEIGDVKITYEIFSPDYITFFGKIENKMLVPYGNFIEVNFTDTDKKTLIQKYKIKLVIELLIFSVVTYIALFISIKLLRLNNKELILDLVPYFNEYIIFGNIDIIVISLFFILFFIAVRLYILLIIPLILLYYFRQIDYYSI